MLDWPEEAWALERLVKVPTRNTRKAIYTASTSIPEEHEAGGAACYSRLGQACKLALNHESH